jgi:uncharacterized protein (TIGR00730 family)
MKIRKKQSAEGKASAGKTKATSEGNGDAEPSQPTSQEPISVSRAELSPIHQTANRLVGQLEKVPDGDLVGEMVANGLLLLRNQTNRGDLKLISKSLQEMRYALKVFAPYRDVLKVSIFGSARTPETHPDYAQAATFGRAMADAGWMVITGAGGGIMAAGHGGGGPEASFGLAIRLPFEQATNTFIANDPKLVHFKYFFTRKLMFVRFSHAIALFPGGFGTMDEGFEVLTLVQTGKSVPMPIVFIDSPGGNYWSAWQDYVEKQLLARGLVGASDLSLYKITTSVPEAVDEIRHFYSNYHSIRFTRNEMAMRLQRAPTPRQLEEITRLFGDLAAKGYRVSGPLPVERDEPALAALPRLVFEFNRRDHGRLRMLIDHLNNLPA